MPCLLCPQLVSVPHFEWLPLASDDAKAQYLRTMLA
jgi:hypothetical protein